MFNSFLQVVEFSIKIMITITITMIYFVPCAFVPMFTVTTPLPYPLSVYSSPE